MMGMLNRVIISAESHDGRGIGDLSGKKVFLENALLGEEVNFTYTKRHNNFDEGEVIEVIKASNLRTEPKCRHFAICGGCSLQHMKTAAQVAFKQNVLLEQLHHFGGTTPLEILPPLNSIPWGYRHKARLSAKFVHKKHKVLVGFHEKQGRYIADLQVCEILHPSIGPKLSELSELIASLTIYQFVPQIEIAVGENFSALVFRHLKDLASEDIAKLQKFGEQLGFAIYLQPEGVESIHCISKTPAELLSYNLPDHNLELFFHPTDFTQINQYINKNLVTRVLELLEPNQQDIILDLFCGLGNFTLPLAKHCSGVVGVEGDMKMVMRATSNASHNKITNAKFYKADLAKDCSNEVWSKQKFAKIVLDPPRTGAIDVVKDIEKYHAKKIIYVSCNPATLARDTKELIRQGYILQKAGVIDMFPHTKHVEALALFQKYKNR